MGGATVGTADAGVRAARTIGYETARPDVLALVPPTAERVLELGCSNGALGAAIKERRPSATVLGVELDPDYAAVAQERLDRVVVGDAEAFAAAGRPPETPFDLLICADVLEHLADPWTTLTTLAGWLSPGSIALVSVPNVLSVRALAHVGRELRWPRRDLGVFDRTHLRWFTLRDAQELVAGAGLEVVHTHFNTWGFGRAEPLARQLTRTPLKHFVAPQHIVVGRRPA